MDMGSLRAELQLPHHFITGDEGDDLDDDIMILGSTPQVSHGNSHVCSIHQLHQNQCQMSPDVWLALILPVWNITPAHNWYVNMGN